MFMIRYNEGFAQILSEVDFSHEISGNVYRSIHPYWQTINCILLAPQNKIGLGKHIKFTFSPVCIEKEITKEHKFHKNLSKKLQGDVIFDYE